MASFRAGDWDELAWWQLGPLVPGYVVYFAVKELIGKRVTILTASLAFATALSVVPLLSVTISFLAAFGLFDAENTAMTPYLQQLFPAAASEIAQYLEKFARTSAGEVAGVGAVALVIIGVFLFQAVERVFNIIWDSTKSRPWLAKVFAFTTLITFGPVLGTLSIVLSARAQLRLSQFGIDASVDDRLIPFGLALLLFTALNYFMPQAKVRWWAAVLGGAFTAIAFELGKWGFNLYVTELIFVPYNQIYGALGLFPLFLVWLYVIWIIILIGAELSYCAQNLRNLISIASVAQAMPERFQDHIFSPLVGLELYAPVARAFKSGDGRVAQKDLVRSLGYSETVVATVVERLAEAGALDVVEDREGEVRILPSKQLDDIQLLDFVQTFVDLDQEPNSIPMAKLLNGYKAVTLEVLRGESALALIPGADELGKKYAALKPWDPLPPKGLAETSSQATEDEPGLAEPSAPVAEPTSLAEPSSEAGLAPAREAEPSPVGLAEPSAPSTAAARGGDFSGGLSGLSETSDTHVEPSAPAAISVADQSLTVEDIPAGVEQSDEGIQIKTEDILVTENSEQIHIEDAKKARKKSRTEELNIELGDVWGDFNLDDYDSVLASTDDEDPRETAELDMEEVHEIGDEKSAPPPMPGSKKK